MDFVSVAYIIFLAISCLLYYIMPKAARPVWMLACSYVFYVYSADSAKFIWLLLGASALVYICALFIELISKKHTAWRKVSLAAGIVISLAPLVYYKYANFALSIYADITHGKFSALKLAVPMGISYFILMGIGYLIDVYRDKQRAVRNPVYVALFLSFFPCIIAGPIERAPHMMPQFCNDVTFDYNKFTGGAFRVLWGMAKKLVISQNLSVIISAVYGHMTYYDGPILLLASIMFSYQLYIDFSALSDIAIGTGAMFGFDIMENFTRPFAAQTFSDLWRRWHISLSTWFRDYLYFPLGGSRKGKARAYINQIIIFTVSGLWHGASFGYVIWGFINGIFLCVGKATSKLRAKIDKYNPLYYFKYPRIILKSFITFMLFTLAFIFFCAEVTANGIEDAFYLYAHLFTGWETIFTASFADTLVAIGITEQVKWTLLGGIALIEGFEFINEPSNKIIRRVPLILRWPLYISLILAIAYLGNLGVSSFIYGRF